MFVGIMLALAAAAPGVTLADAFAQAAQHGPDLAVARARLPVVEAGVVAASALPNPSLSVSLGRDEPQFIAGIGWRLPFFGQRSSAIAAAKAELPLALADVAQRAVELHAGVRRAYYAVVLAKARRDLAVETARLSHELADLTQTKFDLGAAPRLEASQGALAARRADADQRDRAAALQAALPALNALLGQPADAPLEVTDALTPLPALPTLDVVLASIEKHPRLQAELLDREAANARAARERAAIRPAPDVSLEFSNLSDGLGLRGTMAFEAPVLYRNQGAVRAAEAEADLAEIRAKATRAQLTAAAQSAWLRLSAALARARFFSEDQVPAAREVESLARLAYREGRAPLVSVLQAQADVTAARAQELEAAAEAQDALADIEEATGVGF